MKHASNLFHFFIYVKIYIFKYTLHLVTWRLFALRHSDPAGGRSVRRIILRTWGGPLIRSRDISLYRFLFEINFKRAERGNLSERIISDVQQDPGGCSYRRKEEESSGLTPPLPKEGHVSRSRSAAIHM